MTRSPLRPARTVAVGLAILVAVALAAAGCSDTSSTTAASTSTTTTVKDTLTGSLTVLAASSLTEVFAAEKTAFLHLHPNVTLTFSFGASSALVQQLQSGAPADVIATADTATLQPLATAKTIKTGTVFATNSLEILVPAKNPAKITALADLAKPTVKVALCAAQVPCGKFANQILTKAGLTVTPVTLEDNVKGVVTKVSSGEVDAGIVYKTDAKAALASGDEGIVIPPAQNAVASYPAAAVTASANPTAAQAFVDFLTSDQGHQILIAAGFANA